MLDRSFVRSAISTGQLCLRTGYRTHGFEILAVEQQVELRVIPASSDDGTLLKLRPTLKVVAPEHRLHLRGAEVRGEGFKRRRKVHFALGHAGCRNEGGAPALQANTSSGYRNAFQFLVSWYSAALCKK